jgi:hypothetical protein
MPVSFGTFTFAGAPDDGVDEVQLLTPSGTISGGDFTLTFDGEETDPIDWDATAAEIQAALEALPNVGEGNVVCTDGPIATDPVTVTFAGALAGLPVAEMTCDDANLTGSTPAIAVSTDTAGVRGTYRGAQGGAVLLDTTGGVIYENTGTAQTPAWTDFSNLGA